MLVDYIDHFFEEEIGYLHTSFRHTLSTTRMARVSVSVLCKSLYKSIILFCETGKHQAWLLHVDKLICKMLVNGTLPSSIQAYQSIVSRLRYNHGMTYSKTHQKIVHNSVYGDKDLGAYQMGNANANALKHMHYDEGSCHQTSLLDIVMRNLTKYDQLKTM